MLWTLEMEKSIPVIINLQGDDLKICTKFDNYTCHYNEICVILNFDDPKITYHQNM